MIRGILDKTKKIGCVSINIPNSYTTIWMDIMNLLSVMLVRYC